MEERATELHKLRGSICRLSRTADSYAAAAVLDLAWARQNLQKSLLRHDEHRVARDTLAADEWRRVYGQVDPEAQRLLTEIEGEAAEAEARVKGELGESDKEALSCAIRDARQEIFDRRRDELEQAQAKVTAARNCANTAQLEVLNAFPITDLKEQVDMANELDAYARDRVDRLTTPGVPILQIMRG